MTAIFTMQFHKQRTHLRGFKSKHEVENDISHPRMSNETMLEKTLLRYKTKGHLMHLILHTHRC
jgi:hypothetical protein